MNTLALVPRSIVCLAKEGEGYVVDSGMATSNVADKRNAPMRFIFGYFGWFSVDPTVTPVIARVVRSYLPDSPLAVR